MPSRDDQGRPLSGAALRRRRMERGAPAVAAAPARPAAPGLRCPPPTGSVAEAVAWAAGVQARAAVAAAAGREPERVRAITSVVKDLGKLKGQANDSELVVKALLHYKGTVIDVHGDDPPAEPEAIAVWAWWRLVALLDEVVGAELVDECEINHRAKTLTAIGAVFPSKLMKAASDALDKG